eukprot:537026_1
MVSNGSLLNKPMTYHHTLSMLQLFNSFSDRASTVLLLKFFRLHITLKYIMSLHTIYVKILLIIYIVNADDCNNNNPGTLCVIDGGDAGDPITCRANDPCEITCSGSGSCGDDTIDAEFATDVEITCTGTDACKGNTEIICGTGDCILKCLNSATSCED